MDFSKIFTYPDRSFDSFGWYQLCETTFDHIRQILPEGRTILELGSGWGSTQLARHYKVFTVEEELKYLGKDKDVEYLYVPFSQKTLWYNVPALKAKLPKDYDFLLVDGPSCSAISGRRGFLDNLNLFRHDVTMLFDDLHFTAVYQMFMEVAKELNRMPYLYPGDMTKNYGVLYVDR